MMVRCVNPPLVKTDWLSPTLPIPCLCELVFSRPTMSPVDPKQSGKVDRRMKCDFSIFQIWIRIEKRKNYESIFVLSNFMPVSLSGSCVFCLDLCVFLLVSFYPVLLTLVLLFLSHYHHSYFPGVLSFSLLPCAFRCIPPCVLLSFNLPFHISSLLPSILL